MATQAIEFGRRSSDDTAGREPSDLRLGIVGAGKLGTTIARAAIGAGYEVALSGSGPADEIALTVDVLAPGARAVTTDEVVREADIIILAVPTHRFRELPNDLFDGKILVDAMNYWEPVDGADPELAGAADGTSLVVQQRFPSARVVKSLNQFGYHELEEHRRPRGTPNRIAIAAAGDDRAAVRAVMRLVDRLGFDPVDAGELENGVVLEPDGSPFAITYSADELSNLIGHRSGPLHYGAIHGRPLTAWPALIVNMVGVLTVGFIADWLVRPVAARHLESAEKRPRACTASNPSRTAKELIEGVGLVLLACA